MEEEQRKRVVCEECHAKGPWACNTHRARQEAANAHWEITLTLRPEPHRYREGQYRESVRCPACAGWEQATPDRLAALVGGRASSDE